MLKCSKEDCTGCGGCAFVCPKQAIKMEKTKDGFIYPKIEKELCIGCGGCNKVCPVLNKPLVEEKPLAYAVQLKDRKILQQCASGGAFYGIAKIVLEQNGNVFGVKNQGTQLVYQRVSSIKNLKELVGSKYYQCSINKEGYDEIAESTQNNLTLVSGTPCMVAAIQNMRNINRNNLITFEILCQGVPSELVIKRFYEEKAKKKGTLIKSHSFRSKDRYVGKNYLNRYEYEDGTVEYLVGEEDPLSLSFQRQIFLRESCYRCKYANTKRSADFTAGDLWEIESTEIEKKRGCSILVCNTLKAQQLMEDSSALIKKKIDVETSLMNNIPYHHPVKRPRCRKWSYKLLLSRLSPTMVTKICCWKYYIKHILIGKRK